MSIDDRRLGELLVESQDLQSDAVRTAKARIPDLREIGAARRAATPDPAIVARYNDSRRGVLQKLGLGGGAFAARGLFVGGFGAALATIVAKPAAADEALDIQMLQTASSLEILAVATYGAALTLPFIKDGNKVVVAFAETTMKQHDEHNKAFQAQAEALGGKAQTMPNPTYKAVVDEAVPTLKTPLDVVKLAATLEEVASDTYLSDLTQFQDVTSKEIMASVMGVEVQHLATLRAVGALLEANAPQFIAIPVDLATLPAAAGSVAFPEAFQDFTEETVAPPESGAVK